MLKKGRELQWTCRQCLRQQRQRQLSGGRRLLSTAASPAVTGSFSAQAHDDKILRDVFDSKPFWKEFSKRKAGPSAARIGLVGNTYLQRPDGFGDFAQVTLHKCQRLVEKILQAKSVDEYRGIARDFDQLSDLLCRVIDLTEFMKDIHPDRAFREAASQAHAMMYEYMNILNTMAPLHGQLQTALRDRTVTSAWSEEERAVAEILMLDFARSAIHRPEKVRQRFVDLSNEIVQLGSEFVNNVEPARSQVVVDSKKLTGLHPTDAANLTNRWTKKATIPVFSHESRVILAHAKDEGVRKEVYLANRTSSKDQIYVLEELLRKRTELAKISGYDTYADMTLSSKMAKTPEAVNEFLQTLVETNKDAVSAEISRLLEMKIKADPSATSFRPWDHSYYINRFLNQPSNRNRSRMIEQLPAYFSLGTVMQGLSRLFTHLYGVRFVPNETSPGETWNPDVRRLDVFDDSGHIAVIYCDLFSRPGKLPNPTHFALRCSREISHAEVNEAASLPSAHPAAHPNDGMATSYDPETKTLQQLPTIALICDFPTPSPSSSTPSLLPIDSVRTLFHEMGHAIHSVIGRTKLQTVAGTRCATDFAELPSVLMENFATAPEVLSLYARHWSTDEPLPASAIEHLNADAKLHSSMIGGTENESQILMAMLDQAYHSSLPLSSTFNSTDTYHQIWSQYGLLSDGSSTDSNGTRTSWQGFFTHLHGYGATYYAYLFDRAIARRVWEEVFAEGKFATNREKGEVFKKEVLRWGGGRDPWVCIEHAVGKGEGILAGGDERAMKEVGRWGVGV